MFITNEIIGKGIKITKDRSTLAGTFTAGHKFTIIGSSERGLDLVDKDGNKLLESMMYTPDDGFEYYA